MAFASRNTLTNNLSFLTGYNAQKRVKCDTTKSPQDSRLEAICRTMCNMQSLMFFLFSHQFLRTNPFIVFLYMLTLNKHLKLLFLRFTVCVTNFSAPFHMNFKTLFTPPPPFQANQITSHAPFQKNVFWYVF